MVTLMMSHFLTSSNASNHRERLTDTGSSKPTTTIFQSNLSCVLNDPKKTRTELSTFFTKTWGYSFVDRLPDPLSRLANYSLNDFESYFDSLRKSEKHGRLHLEQQSTEDSNIVEKPNSINTIPALFRSSRFSLSDTATFNQVFPEIISSNRPISPIQIEQTRSRTISTTSDKSEGTNRRQSSSSANGNKPISNGITSSPPRHSINSTTRLLQDRYTHYLDEIELSISRSLATKSDFFHDVVRSHDEIQSFLNTTCQAIASLRSKLSNYDSQSLLALLRLCRSLRQRQNQRELLKRLESISIIKQNHIQIRALLTTSDYLSALDLIDTTREIISTEFNDLSCLRSYDVQLNELYLLIVNMMRQEFSQCLNNELLVQQDTTSPSNDYIDEDKFVMLLIGLIRVQDDKYIDEIRSKFEQFMNDIIERLISLHSKDNGLEKSSKTSSEKSSSNDHSSINSRYTFSSSITPTSVSFSTWFRSANRVLVSVEQGFHRLRNLSHLIDDVLSKQQTNQFSMISLLHNVHDTIQDRLITVFNQECTRLQVHFECLPLNEYTQMTKLIEGYILNTNHNDKKYTSRPLKTFLQGQTSKFLTYFHNERKQRLTNTLNTEQWKQVSTVPRSIQNSVDEIFNSTSSISENPKDTLVINNEHFILPNISLHLFMLILDYCSCAQMLSMTSINDVQHRLIELLNIFNSKTCQLVLGAGAVDLGTIRKISVKTLAITCRCLQFIKITLPKIKLHFDKLQASSESTVTISSLSSTKQFEQLTKLYSEHINEIHEKLISIIKSAFEETLSTYEVRAPVPSECFRTLVTGHIVAVHNGIARIVSSSDLILLFTRLNSIFKYLLANRLRQLRITNDGGPQHGLLTSDLLFYIKQIQSLPGLEMLEIHVDEIWTTK